jgi:hypothetical protein
MTGSIILNLTALLNFLQPGRHGTKLEAARYESGPTELLKIVNLGSTCYQHTGDETYKR